MIMKDLSLVKTFLIAGITILTLTGVSANASDTQTNNQTGDETTLPNVVMNSAQQSETRRMEINKALAPIKSQKDLQTYLESTFNRTSPLDALPFAAKQRFIASLKFNQKGLTTFEYGDLEDELTPTQIYRILSLFGIQQFTARMKNARVETQTDKLIMSATPYLVPIMKDHYCFNRGSCAPATNWGCTDNC